MNPVVAHLERGNAGACARAPLNLDQVGPGVLAQAGQFVQGFVVATPDHAAIADNHRRIVDDGFLQHGGELRVLADTLGKPGNMFRGCRRHRLL